MTSLPNPMAKIGLVNKEQNARDARVSLVALSGSGTRVFKEASISFTHAAEAIFERLDADQQRGVSDVLKALL